MKKVLFAVVVATLLLVVVLALMRKRDPEKAQNLILISIDTLRADHLGCYGYPLDQKNISRLAAESLVYDRAFSTMPTTEPAMASVLTSLYPRTHTVRKNGIELPEGAVTLAEILKQYGWKTAAFIGAFPLDRRFKTNQGFDEYRDSIGAKGKRKNLKFEVNAEQLTNGVLKWLKKNPVRTKTFLWLHYFDPHTPYAPPKQFAGISAPLPNRTAELNGYDGEIAFLDQQLGVLFEALQREGLMNNSLIVFVSDHGEGFGEHGYFGHGWFLYDEVTQVALMIRGPGIDAGRSTDLIQHVDIAPGILDYFGIPFPATFQGKSWWNALQEETIARDAVWIERRLPPVSNSPEDDATQEHQTSEDKWVYRTASEMFLWSSDGKHEYYDLTKDPAHKQNLFSAGHPRASQLETQGLALRDRYQKAALKPARDIQEHDEETREGLKSLGYTN